MTTTVLYQFPISHFCEKARWALDYKGIDYRVRNLIPGPHRAAMSKLAARSSVPLLVSGGEAIQGSAEIINWAERRHPTHRLTPSSSLDASMAAEWERSADGQIGVPLRCLFYYHVLQDRTLSTTLLTDQGPWWGRPLYRVIFPRVRSKMRAMMKIDADSAKAAERQLERSFEHLEARIATQAFLAGPIFSRADLSVSALLAPMWRELPALPAPLVDFINAHRQRPALQWAQGIYQQYRLPAPASTG